MIGAVGVLGAERSRPVLERFGMKSIRKAASAAWHNRERKPGNAPPRWLLAGHDGGRRGRQLRNSPSPVEMCNKSVNPATCTVPSGTPSAVGVGAAPTRVLGMRSRVAGVGSRSGVRWQSLSPPPPAPPPEPPAPPAPPPSPPPLASSCGCSRLLDGLQIDTLAVDVSGQE